MNPSIENLVNARIEAAEHMRDQAREQGIAWRVDDYDRRIEALTRYLNGEDTLRHHGEVTALTGLALNLARDARDQAAKDLEGVEVLAGAGASTWVKLGVKSARRQAKRAATAADTTAELASMNPKDSGAYWNADRAREAAAAAEQSATDAEALLTR